MINYLPSKEIIFYYLKPLLVSAIFFGLLFIFALILGCDMFKDKALAAETKVIGVDAEVPSIYSSGTAIASVKLGYISTKYCSAPNSSSASVQDDYKDVSLISISGTATSKIQANNDSGRIK